MARQGGSYRKQSSGRTARCACCAARLLPRNCEVDQSETIGSRLLQRDATPNASSPTRLSSGRDIFSAGRQTRSKCEAASSTSARLSRNPTWQMLAEARFIVDICVEGSRIPAVQVLSDTFRRRRNFLFLVLSCVFEGGTL